jgi:hypothetical protein
VKGTDNPVNTSDRTTTITTGAEVDIPPSIKPEPAVLLTTLQSLPGFNTSREVENTCGISASADQMLDVSPSDQTLDLGSLSLNNELDPDSGETLPHVSDRNQFDFQAVLNAAFSCLTNSIAEAIVEFCVLLRTASRLRHQPPGSKQFDFNAVLDVVQKHLLHSVQAPVEEFCSTIYAARRLERERTTGKV